MIRTLARGARAGFTVLELVVAMAVVAALAAFIAPAVLRSVEAGREDLTRQQLAGITDAVLGNPTRGTFGYLGDIGDVPTALTDLLTKPGALPVYGVANAGGVGMGWRGPYLNAGAFSGDTFRDAWGQALVWGGPSGSGATGRGQIRSLGPDGTASTADDILYPLDAVDANGTLLVTVYVNNLPNPLNVTVTLYRTVNGAQNVQATQSTGAGFTGFTFSVHQGVHAVRAVHTSSSPNVTVERTLTSIILPRNQHHLEIRLRTTGTVAT